MSTRAAFSLFLVLSLPLAAQAQPADAEVRSVEPTGRAARWVAALADDARFGALVEEAGCRWGREGRGLRATLERLRVERFWCESEDEAARLAADAATTGDAARRVERRGTQVVVLAGPALDDPGLAERALELAWERFARPRAVDSAWSGAPGLPLPSIPARFDAPSAPGAASNDPLTEATLVPNPTLEAGPDSSTATPTSTITEVVEEPATVREGDHGASEYLGHFLSGEELVGAHPLALGGMNSIRERTRAHRDAIAATGVGRYYGDHSSFASMTPAEREAWIASHATVSPPPSHSVAESSCIGWALDNVGAAYEAAGRGDTWRRIKARVVAEGSKGTVLARELIADGWKAVYFNPDVSHPEDGSDEHPYTAYLARKNKRYYGLPLAGNVLNYRPHDAEALEPGERATPLDGSGIERLERIPFWFGLARGGSHTFVGHGATVSEFHWASGPDDPEAIEETPLAEFGWLSGIVVVPPGSWD